MSRKICRARSVRSILFRRAIRRPISVTSDHGRQGSLVEGSMHLSYRTTPSFPGGGMEKPLMSHASLDSFLRSTRMSVSSLSNRRALCKHNLASQVISLVRPRRRLSLAPTADCTGRRAQTRSRSAGTLTARLAPTFPGRTLIAASTVAASMITGRIPGELKKSVVDVSARRREAHDHRGPRQGPQPEWAETRRVVPKTGHGRLGWRGSGARPMILDGRTRHGPAR